MSSVELLEKFEAEEGLPEKKVMKCLIHKDGFSSRREPKIDFSLFMHKHSKEIDELPEFVDCAKYILKNQATLRETGIIHEEGRPLYARDKIPFTRAYFPVLYLFLNRYLERVNKLSFEDDLFKDTYIEFERYIYKSVLLYKVTAPLQGLSGNIGEINFSKNLKLRPLSDSEKAEYLEMQWTNNRPKGFSNQDLVRIADAKYALETTYSHRKDAQMPSSYRERLEDAITILSLFKSGRVDFSVIKVESALWNPFRPVSYRFESYREVKTFRDSYKLDIAEKQGLLHFFRVYHSFKKSVNVHTRGKHINLALERFKSGIEESNVKNMIIDFLIAFEALYLEGKDELAYRLSTRAAILLGKNDVQTERIKEVMVDAYNIRSKIVHGKDVPPIKSRGKIIELHKFVQEVEEYLRESLKSFMVLAKTYRDKENVLKLFDKSLIDVKSRKKLRIMMRHAHK